MPKNKFPRHAGWSQKVRGARVVLLEPFAYDSDAVSRLSELRPSVLHRASLQREGIHDEPDRIRHCHLSDLVAELNEADGSSVTVVIAAGLPDEHAARALSAVRGEVHLVIESLAFASFWRSRMPRAAVTQGSLADLVAPRSVDPAVVGRSQELREIERALLDPSTAALHVSGLSGAGKRTLIERACNDLGLAAIVLDCRSMLPTRECLEIGLAAVIGDHLACEPPETTIQGALKAFASAPKHVLILRNVHRLASITPHRFLTEPVRLFVEDLVRRQPRNGNKVVLASDVWLPLSSNILPMVREVRVGPLNQAASRELLMHELASVGHPDPSSVLRQLPGADIQVLTGGNPGLTRLVAESLKSVEPRALVSALLVRERTLAVKAGFLIRIIGLSPHEMPILALLCMFETPFSRSVCDLLPGMSDVFDALIARHLVVADGHQESGLFEIASVVREAPLLRPSPDAEREYRALVASYHEAESKSALLNPGQRVAHYQAAVKQLTRAGLVHRLDLLRVELRTWLVDFAQKRFAEGDFPEVHAILSELGSVKPLSVGEGLFEYANAVSMVRPDVLDQVYASAAAANPGDPYILSSWIHASYRIGHFEQVSRLLESARVQFPVDALIERTRIVHLELLRAVSGERVTAVSSLRQAVERALQSTSSNDQRRLAVSLGLALFHVLALKTRWQAWRCKNPRSVSKGQATWIHLERELVGILRTPNSIRADHEEYALVLEAQGDFDNARRALEDAASVPVVRGVKSVCEPYYLDDPDLAPSAAEVSTFETANRNELLALASLQVAVSRQLLTVDPSGMRARRAHYWAKRVQADLVNEEAVSEDLSPQPAFISTSSPRRRSAEADDEVDFNRVDVVVSFNSRDRDAIGSLVDALRTEGIRSWTDQAVAPGARWEHEYHRAVQACGTVIVCFGPSGIGGVQDTEITLASRDALSGTYVIPVLLAGFAGDRRIPDRRLANHAPLDMNDGPEAHAVRRLVQAIRSAGVRWRALHKTLS